MDEYERLMVRERLVARARAQWRARDERHPAASLWGWEFWWIETKELHHVAGARYGDITIAIPVSMHRELTRRMMEEHPPPGPDPTNPVEIAGRYDLGFAELFYCIADFVYARGLARIEAAQRGKRKL
jgi:hypothetical protein